MGTQSDHHFAQNFDPRLFRWVPGLVEATFASKIKKIVYLRKSSFSKNGFFVQPHTGGQDLWGIG